jgi:hypothetical protein
MEKYIFRLEMPSTKSNPVEDEELLQTIVCPEKIWSNDTILEEPELATCHIRPTLQRRHPYVILCLIASTLHDPGTLQIFELHAIIT